MDFDGLFRLFTVVPFPDLVKNSWDSIRDKLDSLEDKGLFIKNVSDVNLNNMSECNFIINNNEYKFYIDRTSDNYFFDSSILINNSNFSRFILAMIGLNFEISKSDYFILRTGNDDLFILSLMNYNMKSSVKLANDLGIDLTSLLKFFRSYYLLDNLKLKFISSKNRDFKLVLKNRDSQYTFVLRDSPLPRTGIYYSLVYLLRHLLLYVKYPNYDDYKKDFPTETLDRYNVIVKNAKNVKRIFSDNEIKYFIDIFKVKV